MDTSPEYVKMCDTPLIQEAWKPTEGDWMWVRGRDEKGNMEYLVLSSNIILSSHDTIYIPMLSDLHVSYKRDESLPPSLPVNIRKQTYTRFPLGYFVWLPRQDQLQEMVDLPIDELWNEFTIWVDVFAIYGQGDRRLREYKSFEQLWLNYVMHEKYGKKWTGTEWST